MTLSGGTGLGPQPIAASVGAGAVGDVSRARGTDRDSSASLELRGLA